MFHVVVAKCVHHHPADPPWLYLQWRLLHHLLSYLTEGLSPRRAGAAVCFVKGWGFVPFCTVLITIKETLVFWAEHSTCHLVRSLYKFYEKTNILGFFPTIFLWTKGNLFCAGLSLSMVILQCYQLEMPGGTHLGPLSFLQTSALSKPRLDWPCGFYYDSKLPFNNHQETEKTEVDSLQGEITAPLGPHGEVRGRQRAWGPGGSYFYWGRGWGPKVTGAHVVSVDLKCKGRNLKCGKRNDEWPKLWSKSTQISETEGPPWGEVAWLLIHLCGW